MYCTVKHFFLAIVSLLLFCPVLAQPVLGETTVRLVPKKQKTADAGHIREHGFIEISGHIRKSAVAKLAAVIPEARKTSRSFTHDGEPIVRLFLNSPGGEVLAATQLGLLVRSQAIEVWVDKGAECSSACILILAGGVSRAAVPGARLGIHRPYFSSDEFASLSYAQSQDRYSKLADAVRQYLARMGMSEALYEAMLKVESRKMVFVSEEFAAATGLLGNDPAYQEWRRAKDQKALGTRRLEILEQYTDCINAGSPDSKCSKVLELQPVR